LEKKAEQFLPGSKGVGEKREGEEGGQRGEMAQTLYAHMNKFLKSHNICKISHGKALSDIAKI
jgi:hypothetical protein